MDFTNNKSAMQVSPGPQFFKSVKWGCGRNKEAPAPGQPNWIQGGLDRWRALLPGGLKGELGKPVFAECPDALSSSEERGRRRLWHPGLQVRESRASPQDWSWGCAGALSPTVSAGSSPPPRSREAGTSSGPHRRWARQTPQASPHGSPFPGPQKG